MQKHNLSGLLLDDEEAKSLSQKLHRLGDHVKSICSELDLSGYGEPARAIRRELEALAATEEGADSLWGYWAEYAKERLAGLVGPMDVLKGRLPSFSAYRSPMLAGLRSSALAGTLTSESPIQSPQIQPTLKRFVEMLPDDPRAIRINDEVKLARKTAAQNLSLHELRGFERLPAKARYDMLIDRYSANLLGDGFALDSHRRTGIVYRRATSDGCWSFVFVDDSRDCVDIGTLSIRFGLTHPKRAVLPSSLPSSVAAAFGADDVVPGFRAIQGFAPSSYGEFCLSADSCAYLARILFRHIDSLLYG